MRSRVLIVAALGLVSIGALTTAQAEGAAGINVTAASGRSQIQFKDSTRISGRVTGHTGGDGGLAVELQADPYPYGAFAGRASSVTASNGSYWFRVAPSRNTR